MGPGVSPVSLNRIGVAGRCAGKGESNMGTTLDLSELKQKIGQLFMIGIPGPRLDRDTDALIREYNIGGVILFSRNIQEPLQLTALCRDLQERALKYHGTPLFLAVDQEGGPVARLKEPFTVFPGNRAIGSGDYPERRADEFGRVTAREMRLVGLNMDLAPVVDVPEGEPERHLRGRTFGEDPERVARLGRIVIRALQKNGVMAVAKHFPGLGRAERDPHAELPRISQDLSEIRSVNLHPFRAAIKEGVCGIMTSHALYPALDPVCPATLSPSVLTGLLREEMEYDGLVLTDDLEMGAVARGWGVAEGAAEALEAGADILLVCKDQERAREGLELVCNRVLQGRLSNERLEISRRRIIRAKERFLSRWEPPSYSRVKQYFRLQGAGAG
ncbi:MAG: beta-N-acetylhexosaminidase [Deltaproteobacteria bacterium]|nr:beta-N-acetylhexosaminidase [Deltaproteobacteria bacterium]MBW2303522.1 beta-N-acetylhexosaminidase [Deltaproteobacteria bacterium]